MRKKILGLAAALALSLPASAGAQLMMVRKVGEFQGTITAITPSGSRSV